MLKSVMRTGTMRFALHTNRRQRRHHRHDFQRALLREAVVVLQSRAEVGIDQRFERRELRRDAVLHRGRILVGFSS